MLCSSIQQLKPTSINTINSECVYLVGDLTRPPPASKKTQHKGRGLNPFCCHTSRPAQGGEAGGLRLLGVYGSAPAGCWPAVADTPPCRAPIIGEMRTYLRGNSALFVRKLFRNAQQHFRENRASIGVQAARCSETVRLLFGFMRGYSRAVAHKKAPMKGLAMYWAKNSALRISARSNFGQCSFRACLCVRVAG